MSFLKKIKLPLFLTRKIWRLIFSYPKFSKSNLDDINNYNKYWQARRGEEMGKLSDWQKKRADIIRENIGKNQPQVITDIGCGDGAVLKYLKEKLDITKAIGVDFSDLCLDKAKDFGIDTLKIDLKNIQAIKELPEVDYFLLLEILEHLPNSEEVLEAIYKKTRQGIFFSFPNTGFITYRLRLLFGKFPLQWRLLPGEHLRFWTYQDLKWWLKALGYRKYKIIFYKGCPILNKLWPALFAAGFVVFLKKEK